MQREDTAMLAAALEAAAAVLRRHASEHPAPVPAAARAESVAGSALLTVTEAAAELRVGRGTMYELVRRGEVPSIKLGRLRRIPRKGLVDWAHGQAGGNITWQHDPLIVNVYGRCSGGSAGLSLGGGVCQR